MTVKMQETPSQQADALLALLAEQHDLYSQLRTLSGQQAQCIRDGSTEELLGLLSKRQSVIDSITRSNAQVAPYRENWPTLRNVVAPAQRDRVHNVLDEIEQLLNQVVEQDERDRAELKGVQAQIGTQMTKVNRSGRAIQAYGPPKSNTKAPTFTDRQG
tara:strand:+ start:114 stop:590 length:477 start_codon:yes stop_codon:yes gene_type:complete